MKYPMYVVVRFVLSSVLFISVTSFSMFSDTSTQSQTPVSGDVAPMAVTIDFYDEWESGMQREIRQVSIDGVGHGQVSTRTDGRVTHIATFVYQPDDFEMLSAHTVMGLSEAYLSNELEDNGLIVEGNPVSYKFFFSWLGQVSIVDAEPGYYKTPAVLLSLAQKLRAYIQSAESQTLHAFYLAATPMSPQQSTEIMRLFGTLPEVENLRQLLNVSEHIVLAVPAWLVVLQDDTRQKITDAFGMDAGSDFLYVKSRAGSVIKMEFVAARPAGG